MVKFLSKMLGVNIFTYDDTGYGLATDQGELLVAWRGRGEFSVSFFLHQPLNDVSPLSFFRPLPSRRRPV